MSVSGAEARLVALETRLRASLPAGVELHRNPGHELRIPAAGLARLLDGDRGEAEQTFSPPLWHWRHRAELELLADGAEATRDARLDALLRWVGAAVAGDRTLGGLCDWVETMPGAVGVIAGEGGAGAVKGALVSVVMHYATTSELG